jgi:hypothetical protein
MPPAGDDAAVIKPNSDPFYSSYAFTLSSPDELDEMPIVYLNTPSYSGVCVRGLKDMTRWAISKGVARV